MPLDDSILEAIMAHLIPPMASATEGAFLIDKEARLFFRKWKLQKEYHREKIKMQIMLLITSDY